jgi:hypothetical protein
LVFVAKVSEPGYSIACSERADAVAKRNVVKLAVVQKPLAAVKLLLIRPVVATMVVTADVTVVAVPLLAVVAMLPELPAVNHC